MSTKPPFIPEESGPYAYAVQVALQERANLINTNKTKPMGAYIYKQKLNAIDVNIQQNLDKLGPHKVERPLFGLQRPIGENVILPGILTVLTAMFGNNISPGWSELNTTNYPWLPAVISEEPTYLISLVTTLTEIIRNGNLIMPNQMPDGGGTLARIAEGKYLEKDKSGAIHRVARFPAHGPATWFHTELASSDLYAEDTGTSVALVKRASNVAQSRSMNSKLLLFLNLDAADYDTIDPGTQVISTSLIISLINLVTFRITVWNKGATDGLLDDALIRGTTGGLTEQDVIVKAGQWGTDIAKGNKQLNLSALHKPYSSDPSKLPIRYTLGHRNSSYTEDKLLHFPLVDILKIFTDMINICIRHYKDTHGTTGTVLDRLTPDQLAKFGEDPILIGGTYASTLLSGPDIFAAEAVISYDILKYYAIFRGISGVFNYEISGDGYKYFTVKGGSGKHIKYIVSKKGRSERSINPYPVYNVNTRKHPIGRKYTKLITPYPITEEDISSDGYFVENSSPEHIRHRNSISHMTPGHPTSNFSMTPFSMGITSYGGYKKHNKSKHRNTSIKHSKTRSRRRS